FLEVCFMKVHIVLAASFLAIGSSDNSASPQAPADVYGACEDKRRWDYISKKHRFNASEQLAPDAPAEGALGDGTAIEDPNSVAYAAMAPRTSPLRDDDEHEELPEEEEGEDSWTSRGDFMCHDLQAFPFSYEPHC